jgi:hypothetical protein
VDEETNRSLHRIPGIISLGIAPFRFRKRDCLKYPSEMDEGFFRLQNTPKVGESAVDVVGNFGHAFWVFGKKHGQPTSIRLNVMRVGRHQTDNLRGQIPFATVPFERWRNAA